MKDKKISAQEFNELPRNIKRELERSLEKQGLEMPTIRERIDMVVSVDKELYIKGLKVLEHGGFISQSGAVDVERFLDLAFQNLILANK